LPTPRLIRQGHAPLGNLLSLLPLQRPLIAPFLEAISTTFRKSRTRRDHY
ncbi:hypothetical protein I5P84_07615, partial [Pseudomonas mosselii]|nr:hypothetical protein [Pseudomonas mosselii]